MSARASEYVHTLNSQPQKLFTFASALGGWLKAILEMHMVFRWRAVGKQRGRGRGWRGWCRGCVWETGVAE
jgi:hypothetical protein